MGEGNIFTLCVSPHPGVTPPANRVIPPSGPDRGYPHLSWLGDTPIFPEGLPQGTSHQDWMGVPPVGTGWGTLSSGLDGDTPIGTGCEYPPCQDWMGVSPFHWDWMGVHYSPSHQDWVGYPHSIRTALGDQETEQLHGRKYTSCIHAGGLSCSNLH